MTREDIFDLNGKTPKVGDKIVMSEGWTTSNSYVSIATIKEFIEKPKTLKMVVTLEKSGLWGYSGGPYGGMDKEKTIGFPSEHIKFVIL